jgi:diadenylate cyclase
LSERIEQLLIRLRAIPPHEFVIEFVLIWVVVWLIFRFLRGTRGARVLKGVGLVLILATAMIAGLGRNDASFQRLQFLYRGFLTFAGLALVIVFQPELRRALVRLGEARIFTGFRTQIEPVVDELVKAVAYLSRNKIGAIIALEREVPLGGIIEAGTRLNADVSAELLQAIFWPGSALHDMGVVVRNDKVLAAGVQFPLAEGDDISQELGSRHRAAIGLSLEADCLVIVVSEETGAISLAERGQLLRRISPDALGSMLTRGLVQATDGEMVEQAKAEQAADEQPAGPTGGGRRKTDT